MDANDSARPTDAAVHTLTVTLIGMPASGKSTVGKLLASRLSLPFIDGDRAIEKQTGMTLQALIDNRGMDAFMHTEEKVLLDFEGPGVFAPGGSAILSPSGMAHLQSLGPVVYLYIPPQVMLKRIHNADTRGIAHDGDAGLEALYEGREPLYRDYADLIVDADRNTPLEAVDTILSELPAHFKADSGKPE